MYGWRFRGPGSLCTYVPPPPRTPRNRDSAEIEGMLSASPFFVSDRNELISPLEAVPLGLGRNRGRSDQLEFGGISGFLAAM